MGFGSTTLRSGHHGLLDLTPATSTATTTKATARSSRTSTSSSSLAPPSRSRPLGSPRWSRREAPGAGDDEEDDDAASAYELLYAAFAFLPPYPLYKVLPRDVVSAPAPAWTWFLLVYGVFFTAVTTAVSVRVLVSTGCRCTFLRALLFAAGVAAEVAAAFHILPRTTLARDGAVVTVIHLVVVYLLAWSRGAPGAAATPIDDAGLASTPDEQAMRGAEWARSRFKLFFGSPWLHWDRWSRRWYRG